MTLALELEQTEISDDVKRTKMYCHSNNYTNFYKLKIPDSKKILVEKVTSCDFSIYPDTYVWAKQEFELMYSLRDCENVAKVYHSQTIYSRKNNSKKHIMTMEFLNKGTRYFEEGDYFFKRIVAISSTLEEMSRKRIVHRDIKSENILYTPDGTAKLIDFGLAKCLDTFDLAPRACVFGTPENMSPEQARGELTLCSSDLFSFGSTIYEWIKEDYLFNHFDRTQISSSLARYSDEDLYRFKDNLKSKNSEDFVNAWGKLMSPVAAERELAPIKKVALEMLARG